MIAEMTVNAVRRYGADALDRVRLSGDFLALTKRGKPAGTVTPLTIEELAAIRRVLKAYLATGREDGLVGSAFVKLGALPQDGA